MKILVRYCVAVFIVTGAEAVYYGVTGDVFHPAIVIGIMAIVAGFILPAAINS